MEKRGYRLPPAFLALAAGARRSEWIIAAYFSYTTLLAMVWPLRPGMQWRIWLLNAAVAASYLLMRAMQRSGQITQILRDWVPLALMLAAYKQMGWFAPERHTYALEHSWIEWDRLVLLDWGGRALVELSGPVLPAILDLSYLLVYALPPFCMAMLYAYKRQEQADLLLTIYLWGLFLSYAQFPFWPSEPPRTVFPEVAPPQVHTAVRDWVLRLLGSQGIHTSVFPSAHVSGVAAAAIAMWWIFSDKPVLRWGVLTYALMVAVATVYGRYHYMVDALAGIGVAIAGGWAGRRLAAWRMRRWRTGLSCARMECSQLTTLTGNSMKFFMFMLVAALFVIPMTHLAAQTIPDSYVDLLRSEVKAKKAEIITQVVDLSDEEGKKFWPLQREYELALSKINDERISVIKDYADNWNSLTDAKAKEVATKLLDLQSRRNSLLKKTFDKMSKELSPTKAAKFLQIEHQMLQVLDLQVSTQLPLVK